MNEGLTLVLTLAAGLLLGAGFFAGLWWTVGRGVTSASPALLFLGSMLLRTVVVIAGFYFVADGQWQRLLVCLFGFALARFIVTKIAGPPRTQHAAPAKGASHAP